ncbi:MAG: hypothetical protein MUO72_20575 [Bacteroidales bacterium]|nr:hypothetical protein [Bacteroidales bacterium]
MKRIILISLIIPLIIGSCTQQRSSPIEGTWQLVFSQAIAGDTISETLPGDYTGSQVKTWTKNYVMWVGHYTRLIDTVTIDNYGGGTYKLEGDKHGPLITIGKSIKVLIMLKNMSG